MKDAVVRARIDAGLKQDAEDVLDSLGMSTTEAIRIFLTQVKLRKALPFVISLPSDNADVLRSAQTRQSALDTLYDD